MAQQAPMTPQTTNQRSALSWVAGQVAAQRARTVASSGAAPQMEGISDIDARDFGTTDPGSFFCARPACHPAETAGRFGGFEVTFGGARRQGSTRRRDWMAPHLALRTSMRTLLLQRTRRWCSARGRAVIRPLRPVRSLILQRRSSTQPIYLDIS